MAGLAGSGNKACNSRKDVEPVKPGDNRMGSIGMNGIAVNAFGSMVQTGMVSRLYLLYALCGTLTAFVTHVNLTVQGIIGQSISDLGGIIDRNRSYAAQITLHHAFPAFTGGIIGNGNSSTYSIRSTGGSKDGISAITHTGFAAAVNKALAGISSQLFEVTGITARDNSLVKTLNTNTGNLSAIAYNYGQSCDMTNREADLSDARSKVSVEIAGSVLTKKSGKQASIAAERLAGGIHTVEF